jgi:hypothetical protein
LLAIDVGGVAVDVPEGSRARIAFTLRVACCQNYEELHQRVLRYERMLLHTIAFQFRVEHPYQHLVRFIKSYRASGDLAQIAWSFVNDRFFLLLKPRLLDSMLCWRIAMGMRFFMI